jgi:hypothetical protein
MRVITDETGMGWMVVAEWYGAERVIHRGDLYDCMIYVASI